jgi:hypothetical protein
VPDLAEQIRKFVDSAEPPVTIYDVGALLEERHRSSLNRRRIGHTARRRRTLLIGALIVGLAVVLVSQLALSGQGSSAAAVLDRAAEVAATQPAPNVPQRGQYLFFSLTQSAFVGIGEPGEPVCLLVTINKIDTWVAPDGSGRQVVETEPYQHLLPHENQACKDQDAHASTQPTVSDARYPTTHPIAGTVIHNTSTGENYLVYLASPRIPTSPGPLKQYLDKQFKTSGHVVNEFMLVGTLLEEGAPPALRVALFQLIKRLPGISLIGRSKDEAGRTGLGIAIDGYGNRFVLVFDTKTSAALGMKTVARTTRTLGGQTVPKGTLLDFTNFGPTAVVSSISTVPGKKT